MTISPALRRFLPWVVLLAVVLRIGLLGWNVRAHPELLTPAPAPPETAADPTLSPFGFEASNVAAALVCHGRGFADPFGAPTGPTAWISPGVVALYAVPFALFGCFDPAAVVAVFAVALALSAALTVLMALAAGRLFAEPGAGLLAALFVALSPYDLALFAAASALDLNLHGFLLLLLLVLLLGLRRPGAGTARAAGVALAAAVATLCNPVFALVAAGGLVVALWGSGRRLAVALTLLLAAQTTVVGPYLLYQRDRLGTWVFVKSNLPFELDLGNRPDVAGLADDATFERHHPSQNAGALTRYRRLGEAGFMADHGERFLHRISAGDFARWTARRTGRFFFAATPPAELGSGAERCLKVVLDTLVGAVFLLYPLARRFRLGRLDLLVYTLAVLYAAPHLAALVAERYVLPITPLALLLGAGAALALWRGEPPAKGVRARRTSPGPRRAAQDS